MQNFPTTTVPSQFENVTIPITLWEELSNSIALEQAWQKAGVWSDILLEAEENIRMVRENLKTVQSRQRSYADTRRR
jgi:anti-sigma factor ChrR (cupin superfamily)